MAGQFSITIFAPLEAFQCLYPYDTCTGLVGNVRCVQAQLPAAAPALSPYAIALAVATLIGVAYLGFTRRSSAQ